MTQNRKQPKTATTIRIYLFCFQVENGLKEGSLFCIMNTKEIQGTKLNHKKNSSFKIFSIFYHIYVDFMIKIFFQKIIQILDWINYRLQTFKRKGGMSRPYWSGERSIKWTSNVKTVRIREARINTGKGNHTDVALHGLRCVLGIIYVYYRR